MILRRVRRYLKSELESSRRENAFLIFASFLVTFIFARLFVVFFEGQEFWIFGFHIHHFFYGIILMSIAGWLALNFSGEHIPKFASILFGCGLGLISDEAGLLLTFGDYWNAVTYIVVLIISLIILTAIYFRYFWKTTGRNALSLLREPSGLDLPIVRHSDGTTEPFRKSRIVADLVASGKEKEYAERIMTQVTQNVRSMFEVTTKQIAKEVKKGTSGTR